MSRALAAAGTISYGIYLWHWAVGKLFTSYLAPVRVNGVLPTIGAGVVLVAATLPFAVTSWHFLERPAQRAAAAYASRTSQMGWSKRAPQPRLIIAGEKPAESSRPFRPTPAKAAHQDGGADVCPRTAASLGRGADRRLTAGAQLR